MSNVITITRQFGSMGRHIGMQVAEIMGYKYLDRDILEDTAKKMDVTVRTLQHYDREGLLSPSATSEGGRRLYTNKASF